MLPCASVSTLGLTRRTTLSSVKLRTSGILSCGQVWTYGQLRNGSSTCFPEPRFSVPNGPDSGGRQKDPLKGKEVPLSQLWNLQIYFLILKAKEENKRSQGWHQTCYAARDALELFLPCLYLLSTGSTDVKITVSSCAVSKESSSGRGLSTQQCPSLGPA